MDTVQIKNGRNTHQLDGAYGGFALDCSFPHRVGKMIIFHKLGFTCSLEMGNVGILKYQQWLAVSISLHRFVRMVRTEMPKKLSTHRTATPPESAILEWM